MTQQEPLKMTEEEATTVACPKCGSSNVTGPDAEDFRDCMDCRNAFPELPESGLPGIGEPVTVRVIDGTIAQGIVTGHDTKDGHPVILYACSVASGSGAQLESEKWARPEQIVPTNADVLHGKLATISPLRLELSSIAGPVSASDVVRTKMGTETIGLYLTKSGKEGARVTRTVHANGRVSHSWIGEWGAGSGSLEGIKKSVLFTLTQKRGYKSVIALA
jgi:hypothetical protein